MAVLSPSPGGWRSGCAPKAFRLGCVAFSSARCLRAGACFFSSPLGVSDLSLRHAAGDGFLLGLSPDLGGVWLF